MSIEIMELDAFEQSHRVRLLVVHASLPSQPHLAITNIQTHTMRDIEFELENLELLLKLRKQDPRVSKLRPSHLLVGVHDQLHSALDIGLIPCPYSSSQFHNVELIFHVHLVQYQDERGLMLFEKSRAIVEEQDSFCIRGSEVRFWCQWLVSDVKWEG